MKEIYYVVRVFSSKDSYLYSFHCSVNILDDVIEQAKRNGHKVKVLAYERDDKFSDSTLISESEV